MQTRLMMGTVLSVVLMVFSGCPGELIITPGNWVFTFDGPDGDDYYQDFTAGIRLNADGTTGRYEAPEALTYCTGWWQFGETFTLEQNVLLQDLSTAPIWYTAKVVSVTSLAGDVRWADTGVILGQFTAYLDSQ